MVGVRHFIKHLRIVDENSLNLSSFIQWWSNVINNFQKLRSGWAKTTRTVFEDRVKNCFRDELRYACTQVFEEFTARGCKRNWFIIHKALFITRFENGNYSCWFPKSRNNYRWTDFWKIIFKYLDIQTE